MNFSPLLAFVPNFSSQSGQFDAQSVSAKEALLPVAPIEITPKALPQSATLMRQSSSNKLTSLAAQNCCILIAPEDEEYDDLRALRTAYEKLVSTLDTLKTCLEGHNLTKSVIAKTLFDKRREIALHFKKKMSPGSLKDVLNRNRSKYGDRLGLTWQDALNKYNHNFDVIIQKACETNGADLKYLLEDA